MVVKSQASSQASDMTDGQGCLRHHSAALASVLQVRQTTLFPSTEGEA